MEISLAKSRIAFLTSALLAFLLPSFASATVAYDAFAASTGSGNMSWTHTPVGTPKAAIVCSATGGVSDVTAVSYGGVAMTQVSGSPLDKTTGEPGNVTCWFLGSGISSGAQTVQFTAGGATRRGWSVTLTGADNTELVDVDTSINSDSQANPSTTLQHTSRTSFAMLAFRSGVDGGVGNTTPLSGWTSRDELSVSGASVLGVYTYDTVGSSDVTAGWTQAADDAQMIALAISEVVAAPVAGSTSRTMRLFGSFRIQIISGKIIIHQAP